MMHLTRKFHYLSAAVFALIFYREIFTSYLQIDRGFYTIFSSVMFSATLLVTLLNSRLILPQSSRLILVPLITYALITILTCIHALSEGLNTAGIATRVSLLLMGFLSFLFGFCFNRGNFLRTLCWIFAPCYFIAALQFFEIAFISSDELSDKGRAFTGTHALGYVRVNGLVGNHIEFAIFCCLNALTVVTCFGKNEKIQRFSLLMLSAAGVIMAGSRAGIALYSLLLFIMFGSSMISAIRQVALLLAVVLIAAVAFPDSVTYIEHTFSTEKNFSARYSTALHLKEVLDALTYWREKPILGWGLGFNASLSNKIITDGSLLILLIELGALGLLGLIFCFMVYSYQLAFISPDFQTWIRYTLVILLIASSQVINSAMLLPTNAVLMAMFMASILSKAQFQYMERRNHFNLSTSPA